jgi:hypothetical protein
MYLRGFDRRGAAAAMHGASASGFTVSGCWSDQADFAVCVLFDADDQFGHLYTSRYLPDFSLVGVTLDFDLALTGCQNPTSLKYASVPWGSLSYIVRTVAAGVVSETPGTVPLNITAATGGTAATASFTVAGTPTTYDRLYVVYLGNVVIDTSVGGAYSITTGQSLATVAANLAALINSVTSSSIPLSATSAGATVTVTYTSVGQDGNSVQLLSMYKTAGNTQLYPTGAAGIPPPSGLTAKLTGGADPTSIHVHLDFSALGLGSVRQLWLTFAPALNYDQGTVNPSLMAYVPGEWSAVFSNWTVTDAGGMTPLKLAGPGSTTITSSDSWATRTGVGWVQVTGWYVGGFAWQSAHVGDKVAIAYSCQHVHDLFLGTSISTAGGTLHASIDGGTAIVVSAYASQVASSPISGRRLIASGVAAGAHVVVLTVASGMCLFDFLQAAVLSDPVAPALTYAGVSCACDYDTGATYQIAPARLMWTLSQAGFGGDLDFYAGVFFALKRVRNGGSFRTATVTLSGTIGGADVVWVTVGGATANPPNAGTVVSGATTIGGNPTGGSALGGTVFGVAAFPADTLATLAQRVVDAVNGLFVGICAAPTSTPGQLTIVVLSPINGFSLDVSVAAGSTVALAMAGDIGVGGAGGNEGTWAVDAAQTSPLNRAFVDYLTDLAALVQAAGHTMTVAFSQELLGAPDANTSGGAWSQRFANGSQVLTATGFGMWGAGVVEAVSGSGPQTIQQTGHGYITGNTVHVAQGTRGAVWVVAVVDADHYQLASLFSGAAFTVASGATTFIDLQTTQCNFNPATVTAYLTACYKQAAGILAAAALTPWLQFGEVGWWFYSRLMNEAVGYASWTAPISIGTVAAHGLASGQNVIVAGVRGTTAANGTWPVVVTDAEHFTETGSVGNGTYIAGSATVSGGGMAYYDAYTAAAALAALGLALASFWTQDDDPGVNSHADANFLRGLVYAHMHVIAAAVKAAYSGAKFEWLLPLDTNNPSVYWNAGYPYPQGGRMNNYVNIPSQYMGTNGDIDRVKLEALSWGANYLNLDLAKAAMAYGSSVLTYAKSATAYLIPWYNGACAWTSQYLAAVNARMPLICFWAFDHLCLLSWPLPLPTNRRRVFLSTPIGNRR